MDRRTAIKRLAAGSAIALGASGVLSSRDVAYAASAGPDPGSLPSGSLESVLTVAPTEGGGVSLVIADQPVCLSGEPASTTYTWGSLTEVDLSPSVKGMELSDSGNTATITGVKNNGTQKEFKNGDEFYVEVMMTWECDGLSETRSYRIALSYPMVASSNRI